ncbi:MAG: cupin domain-containing protein [Burkholderiales bacterium]|nr:cupin domain-containing protein [Burkholderiales bacterium]
MKTPNAPPPAPAAPSPEPVLDADVLAWLDEAVAPEPADLAAQARVKRRVLRRIAAESTPRHLTLPAGAEGTWQAFAPGVTMKVLHQAGDTLSYLLRLQPGASLPAHRHPQDEECLVLEGEMRIGELVIGPGGYHLGRRGVLHDELSSPGGALIFLRGAAPEAALAL